MRILMLSWEYPPNVVGGMGRHVAELAPALAQQGLKVHVVSPVTEENMAGISAEDGLMVHRVLTPAIDPSSNIFNQARQVNGVLEDYLRRISQQQGQCDLIHTHDWLTGFAGRVTAPPACVTAAPGPDTSIGPIMDDQSTRPTLARISRCSAPMMGDQPIA